MISNADMPEPIEILHGLDTIYDKIKDWLQERPIQNDVVSYQVVLNGWPFVNMAYPLLEQSLKTLVLVRNADYNPSKDRHSLKAVFDRLDEKDAERMRKGYTAFQSLYSYISYRTLDEFIDNIDNDYVKWRYFPSEGWKNGEPAKTSVEAMLEVSRQALDVLAAHVATAHGLRTVGTRLGAKVANILSNQANLNYQEGLVEAINAWLKENTGSYLNGVAKMVWHENNEGIPAPYQFQPPLADVMENVMKALVDCRDGDVQQFLRRAMNARMPLVWDSKQGIFVVPR